jgi:hypothetical protein
MGKITELLQTRSSTRRFLPAPIPSPILDDILPAEILVFGYPEIPQRTAPKKSLAEIVFYG